MTVWMLLIPSVCPRQLSASDSGHVVLPQSQDTSRRIHVNTY